MRQKGIKGQAWVSDLFIAVVIFSSAMIIFYSFYPNIQKQETGDLKDVYADGKMLSDTIASEGHPCSWTKDDVRMLGILDENNTIDGRKVMVFSDMTLDDYSNVKNSILNMRSDFGIMFTDLSGSPVNISNTTYIGHGSVSVSGGKIDFSAEDEKNLVKFTRVLIYQKKPVRMEVYAWR